MAKDLTTTANCNGKNWQDPRAQARALAEDIVRHWQAGEEPDAEKYLALHPELAQFPEAGVHLVYEEACLRRENGDKKVYDEILARYPQWRDQLELMLRCHQLVEDAPPEPSWPALGETLGEFRLEAELGRGGLGRVFLATQRGLADRLVVLKVTARTGQEHLSLARVQHTNIVPLFAAHEDLARNLRILCMPYFGGATLSRLLDLLRPVPPVRRTGAHLLEALDREQRRWSLGLHPRGAARKMLPGLSYVEAVCWLGACLADALHYAHEHGLIHLDVKPSNVLLAADGQPMLLDFNVAQGPIHPGGMPPEGMGGTPLYMPPEQQAALEALKAGRPAPLEVDGRADIYGVGRLIYEALGGPDPEKVTPSPPLNQVNPQVSPGLADVLARCLAPAPADRYQDAASLAADLRRHNLNLPLKGVANRSLAERWRKWRRRRPFALRRAVMLVAVLGALLGFGLRELNQRQQQRQEADTALAQGLQHFERGAYGPAVTEFQRGLAAVQPGEQEPAGQLAEQLARAQRALAEENLHKLADRLRFLYGENSVPAGETSALRSGWRALWARRAWFLADREDKRRSKDENKRLKTDLLDLATIWADLLVRLAGPGQTDEARREALLILEQAETLGGPSVALSRQRAALTRTPGRKEQRQPATLFPRDAWDYYALGRSLLQDGRLEQAAAALDKAQELEPQEFWPSFYQGICAYRRGRHQEAVNAFRVCLAVAPRCAEVYYNRGLARAALAQDDSALGDYTRALTLNAALSAAALNRGLLQLRKKNYAEAASDLARALKTGADPATVHFNLALVHLAQKDRVTALANVEQALLANPRHEGALRLRADLASSRKASPSKD